MTKALITGATGFIGSLLAKRLTDDHLAVRCLVRRPSPKTQKLEKLGAELVFGHVNDPEAIRKAVAGCDVIYHSAGLRCALQREELFRVNGDSCRLLAEAAAAQSSPPRFILISSLAAAGPSTAERLRIEADVESPVSNYGKSKLAGEKQVREFHDRIPISIVRPGIVFGRENAELLPVFKTVSRIRLHFSAGKAAPVSLIHIDDLLDLLQRVAKDGKRIAAKEPKHNGAAEPSRYGEGVYFGADEECPSYRKFGEMVAESMGQQRIWHLKLWPGVAETAAVVSELMQQVVRRPGVFNRDKIREANAVSWACHPFNAIEELNFRPAASLQQRLNETADWYREQRWV